MKHQAVIEAGPATVRRLCCGADESADAEVVLEWIDDPVALVDGQPAAVPELLRTVLTCPEPAESVEIIHPSWWPARRVDVFTTAARGLADDVITRPRSAVLATGCGDAVFVEIAAGLVAVAGPGTTGVIAEPRLGAPAGVADAVAHRVRAMDCPAAVVIDAPPGVGGAAALATMIEQRLRPEVRVTVVDGLPPIHRAGEALPAVPAPIGRRPRRAPVIAAGGAVVLALLVLHDTRTDTAIPVTYLVEGRVAVQVPPGWATRRVTDGPGSARVEVVSPTDPQRVLHITQAPAVGDALAAVAEPLQRALRRAEDETPGVFVGFDPAGTSAGRPAVTYREIRDGHHVDWAVLVDHGVRIGIGCQRGPGDDDVLRPVCEQAVRSAHTVN